MGHSQTYKLSHNKGSKQKRAYRMVANNCNVNRQYLISKIYRQLIQYNNSNKKKTQSENGQNM